MHSAFAAQALKVQTQNKRTQNKPKSCNSLVLVQLELGEEGGVLLIVKQHFPCLYRGYWYFRFRRKHLSSPGYRTVPQCPRQV